MGYHLFLAGFAVTGMIIAEIIYLIDIFKGKVKPHIFSWAIWAVLMIINSAVQYFEGAYIASSATMVGALLCLLITAVAFSKGEKHITHSDWLCFVSALCAIPLWFTTKDALYAAILITLIDVLGYIPTYRKSWSAPLQENVGMYAFSATTDTFVLLSVTPIMTTTILYPAAGFLTNGGLALLLLLRRGQLHWRENRMTARYIKPVYRFWEQARISPWQSCAPAYCHPKYARGSAALLVRHSRRS